MAFNRDSLPGLGTVIGVVLIVAVLVVLGWLSGLFTAQPAQAPAGTPFLIEEPPADAGYNDTR